MPDTQHLMNTMEMRVALILIYTAFGLDESRVVNMFLFWEWDSPRHNKDRW